MIFSRPFYLLGFMMMIPLIDQSLSKSWRKILLIGVLFLVGTYGKPNATLVIVPALGTWILLTRLTNWNSYLFAFFIFLPSVGLLLFQYIHTYATIIPGAEGGGGRSIGIDLFQVWSTKTSNLSAAILSSIAFPLALAMFRYERIKNSPVLSISWLIFIFATLQRGLLVEKQFASAGNWAWGFMYALNFIFIYSAAELLCWLREQSENKYELVGKYLCLVLFTLHVTSGVIFSYIYRLGHGG